MNSRLTSARKHLRMLSMLCCFGAACGGGDEPAQPDSECRPTGTSPHSNGMTCGDDADCASCSCQANKIGENRCYGVANSNDVCNIDYDCEYGLCFSDGNTKRCVDVTWCESASLDSCFKDLALQTCRLEELCNPASDFSNCVSFQCSLGNRLPVAQCKSELQRLQKPTRAQCTSK